MRRLTVVLLAAGLIVWLAAPALSSRPFVPRAVEFEQGLATRAWVRGADGRWRSPVVVAPKRFDLVGLHWSAGARGDRADPRARCRPGRWGRWTAMASDHGGGTGAEPVWAGGADAYQLRLDRRARGLRARFVNATGSATAADRVRTAMRRAAHTAFAALAGSAAQAQIPSAVPTAGSRPAPPIIPREAWGADQCGRARRPPTARCSSASCTTRSTRTRTRARTAPRWCCRSAAITATRTAGATSATTSSSTASGRSSRGARAGSTSP